MACSGDNHKQFVVLLSGSDCKPLVGVTAEIKRVGFLPVDNHYRTFNLVGTAHQRKVNPRNHGSDIAAAVGIERAWMITALCLIVGMVVFEKLRGIPGKHIRYATAKFRSAADEVVGSLSGKAPAQCVTSFRAVSTVKVTVGINTAHVIHGRGYGRFYARIGCCRADSDTSPSAYADNTYGIRVYSRICDKKIDCGAEIFSVDVRRCHISGLSAALAGKGGVKCKRVEPALCHLLSIQTGTLFLNRPKRATHSDSRKLTGCSLGNVNIGGKGDSIPVGKCHLHVFDFVAFREHLVPFSCQSKFFNVNRVVVVVHFGNIKKSDSVISGIVFPTQNYYCILQLKLP